MTSREPLSPIHIYEGTQMEAHLSSHHRNTVEKIFSHPSSANIEWRQVVSLLEEIGAVTHEHNGKLKVTLGPETEVLAAPRGKDVDIQMVVDLRRMLTQAGFAPDGSPAIPDQRSRDHGDSQWGEPS
jgi:hypothetical protein